MATVTTVKAREAFSEMLNRAAYGKERIVLTRRGKGVAAIIPLEDLALIEAAENRQDAEEIRRRVKEWERGRRSPSRRSPRPTVRRPDAECPAALNLLRVP